ncbi:MAG: hypothetical protein AAF847_01575 [Bacteroidota bacterium]
MGVNHHNIRLPKSYGDADLLLALQVQYSNQRNNLGIDSRL